MIIKVPVQEHTRTPEFISLYSRVPKYLVGKEIILTMKALSTKKSPGQQYLAKKPFQTPRKERLHQHNFFQTIVE